MEHLSNDHEDRPNQHENSQKLCDKAMRAMRVYGTLCSSRKKFFIRLVVLKRALTLQKLILFCRWKKIEVEKMKIFVVRLSFAQQDNLETCLFNIQTN